MSVLKRYPLQWALILVLCIHAVVFGLLYFFPPEIRSFPEDLESRVVWVEPPVVVRPSIAKGFEMTEVVNPNHIAPHNASVFAENNHSVPQETAQISFPSLKPALPILVKPTPSKPKPKPIQARPSPKPRTPKPLPAPETPDEKASSEKPTEEKPELPEKPKTSSQKPVAEAMTHDHGELPRSPQNSDDIEKPKKPNLDLTAADSQKILKSSSQKSKEDLNLFNNDNLKRFSPKESSSPTNPTFSNLSIGGGGGDITIGGKTYLNASRLQGIGYFARMKRILQTRWNPIPPLIAYVSSRPGAPRRYSCVLGVSLDESGRMKKLFLIRGSGVPAYDQEALQTFRESAPFSKPPGEYVKDGELNMTWGFYVN